MNTTETTIHSPEGGQNAGEEVHWQLSRILQKIQSRANQMPDYFTKKNLLIVDAAAADGIFATIGLRDRLTPELRLCYPMVGSPLEEFGIRF